MEKPYIRYLEYELITTDDISFKNPEPLIIENDEFKLILKQDTLKIEPKIRFKEVENAKSFFHKFLRAWEIDFALDIGSEINFKFRDAKIIGKENTLFAGSGSYTTAYAEGSFKREMVKYPKPNPNFRTSNAIEELFLRYKNYKEGKEPLLTMAYYCLKKLELEAGSRKKASKEYKIDFKVLKSLGHISSKKGGKIPSRKPEYVEINNSEINFVRNLIPKIIKQLGKYEVDILKEEDKLTMNDLEGIQKTVSK